MNRAMTEMRRLVDKYPNGFEGLEEQASADAVINSLPNPELSPARASGDLQDGNRVMEANDGRRSRLGSVSASESRV